MSMSKKHFIALADAIKQHNDDPRSLKPVFSKDHLETLARFCRGQNSSFKETRWLDYIAGECGPNGGENKRRAR